MKLDFRIVRFILLTTIFFFTQRNNGCKDPGDFKPPEDTLENPPPPPALLAPIDSFVYMTETGDCCYELRWEQVDSAKLYQLEFVRVGIIGDTIETETTCYTRSMHYPGFGVYQWRVRAANPDWFLTGWSELRQFETRWLPAAPSLCLPPSNTIFFLDSASVYVEFLWARTSDEKTYEIRVYTDLYTVFETEVADTVCIFEFNDMDRYYWQVRASSQYWEKPTDWSSPWNFEVRNNPGLK